MQVRRILGYAFLALLSSSTLLQAQGTTGIVAGRILDSSTGAPVTGAAVAVADRGALSGADGRFAVTQVPAGSHALRVTLIGYADATQSVNVNAGQTATVVVRLTPQAVELAEIVAIGYGTQRAANVTGSVKQVTTEEFNGGRIVSTEELIQGKVAGVQVVDNNEPGGGISIRIRGATSINASSDPLFVVDGVPLGTGAGAGLSAGRNPLNFLNPEDIESVTVLKDASAAAIYGANAANGVVLIQTKTGRRQLAIEYTGSVSGSSITRRPTMLNAEQFRAAVSEYAPQNLEQLQNENTDWLGLVTRDAMGQEHNIAIASSADAYEYRLSLGFLNQDGVIDGTTVERLSAAFNYSQRLFDDRLVVRSSLKGARTADQFTPGGVLSNATQMGPTQPLNDPTAPTGFYDWPGNQLTSADNPVAILRLATDQGTTYRSLGNVQAEYHLPFVSALSANVNLGYDITKATREQFNPSVLHAEIKTGTGGTKYRREDTFQSGLFETYLKYAPSIGTSGNLDVTGGYSYSQAHGEFPWFRATGLSTDLLGNNGIPAAQQIQNDLWIDDSKLISFFGRVNYNFKDRYMVGATLRRDGSSRFGPDNAWGTFPSISAAWRVSEEPFMKEMGALNDLKLRASWGKTGNQSFANYQQFTTYTVGDAQTQVFFGDEFVNTIRPNAADPNIKWEETGSYNFGVDYGFGGGRFSGSIDVYKKNTEDLIFTVPIAAGTNLSNFVTTNIGSMKNSGIELSLSARVLNGGANGLNWTADFNAGHNKNELTSINPFGGSSQAILTGSVSGGVGTLIQVLTPGQPINSFYVYEHKREDGKPMYRDVTGLDSEGKFDNTPDGTINEHDLYVDLSGDGRINLDDRRPFHDPAPDWILGHSSYLSYGKVEGSFTMRAYLGNYVYNNVASNLGTYAEVTRGSPYNLHTSVLETGFEQPQYLSDYYVEEASFLRMDNITLAYNFAFRGQPLRVFGSVQNAFTLTGYTGVDPTAGLNGLDNNIYPRSRTFAAGLNARF